MGTGLTQASARTGAQRMLVNYERTKRRKSPAATEHEKKLIAAFGSRPPKEGRAVALCAETNRAGTTDVAGPGFPSADLTAE